MITKDQAIKLGTGELRSDLHYTGKHDCARHIGPRGGVTENVTRMRVSGKCQVWKTRPNNFRLPVKYGLYESGAITHANNADWHLESECPLTNTNGAVQTATQFFGKPCAPFVCIVEIPTADAINARIQAETAQRLANNGE